MITFILFEIYIKFNWADLRQVIENTFVQTPNYFVLGNVIWFVVKNFLDFQFCLIDLFFCPCNYNYSFYLSHWLNWLDSFAFFLLAQLAHCCRLFNHHRFEFWWMSVKSEDFSNSVIHMVTISLSPSGTFANCKRTWARNFVFVSILYFFLISCYVLNFSKCRLADATHLIVHFNLEVLIWIIKNAWLMGKSSLLIIPFFLFNFISPPSLDILDGLLSSKKSRRILLYWFKFLFLIFYVDIGFNLF